MKRYLLFDAGCSLCTEIAKRVEEASDGWLEARSLREPEMQQLLDRAKPGWKWEPTLVEVDGDEVRVYQGVRMRIQMVRKLGVRRAWRVIEEVQEAIQSMTVDVGRRRFLEKASGIIASGIILGIPSMKPTRSVTDISHHGHPLQKILLKDGEIVKDPSVKRWIINSADLKTIGKIVNFSTSDGVFYQYVLDNDTKMWLSAFPVDDKGFVLYNRLSRPLGWLQSECMFFEYSLDGGADLKFAIVNGKPVMLDMEGSSCGECTSAGFYFSCTACKRILPGCCRDCGSFPPPAKYACYALCYIACCEWGSTCCSCFGA